MSITSYKPDGTSPNQYSVYYADDNVITDSLNQAWRTESATDGVHAVELDLTAAYQPDVFAILNHNFDKYTYPFGGSFQLTLRARSSAPSDLWDWNSPDLEIDLTNQTGVGGPSIIVAWIPPGASYRYWCVHMYGRDIGTINYYQIGRIILTSHFVPAHNYEEVYRWGWKDPSKTYRMEGGARASREKPRFRTVRFEFRDMEIEDQEILLDMFRVSAKTRTWFICFDPAENPSDRSIYGYLETDTLEAVRGVVDLGDLKVRMEEIVA